MLFAVTPMHVVGLVPAILTLSYLRYLPYLYPETVSFQATVLAKCSSKYIDHCRFCFVFPGGSRSPADETSPPGKLGSEVANLRVSMRSAR